MVRFSCGLRFEERLDLVCSLNVCYFLWVNYKCWISISTLSFIPFSLLLLLLNLTNTFITYLRWFQALINILYVIISLINSVPFCINLSFVSHLDLCQNGIVIACQFVCHSIYKCPKLLWLIATTTFVVLGCQMHVRGRCSTVVVMRGRDNV